MLLLLLFHGVYAITPSQKGAILENYKKKQYDLLFESNLGDFSSEFSDIFNISKKVNIYSNVGKKLADQKDNAIKRNDEIQKEIESLKDSIARLDSDIELTRQRVDTVNRNIISTKSEIELNKKQLEIIKKQIEQSRESLLRYLDYLYKKQQTSFGKDKFDNMRSILLNSGDISEIINDLYFTGIIQVAGKKLIDKHRTFVAELYVQKNNLEKKEATLRKLRKNSIIQNKILSDKKDFKEDILKKSKGKQLLYKQYIDGKQRSEKNVKIKQLQEKIKFKNISQKILDKYNCTFVDMSKDSIEKTALTGRCFDINKMIYNESRVSALGNTFDNNFLKWPIKPSYGLSSYFRDQNYVDQFGAAHDAIDIPAPQGTDVFAPADGYVIQLKKPDSEEYAFLAIKHSNGFITLYGHVNEILVDEFEYVYEGQIIAKTGGEFGTNGAGFLTTGPHLHLETFHEKEYRDPLELLDLSLLSYKDIPEKYKQKFLIDFKRRRGYDYANVDKNQKVFTLDGDNQIERQKSLIDKYAVGSFRDWNMWIEEGLDGNIDPTFLMCIGLAESGIGKNLKSPYNVGNVGNNDRGDTRGYPNARSGVYAIVRTLNNKYFKDVSDISYLSGAGRKKLGHPSCRVQGEFCYATDTNHWHKNILKCMTAIKARYVPDTYNFRIEK